ncbi:cytokine receptor common subunit gamma-like [Amphiprion ocellaris]|uniref:Fibronectin type-III domain-containing protein n=1 Tax=Amphiprion ocellaris TaxID=80972 RepID=A0AAQ6AD89_AMPOC|nr:cytokine receptor common subunit gamma-like [Amphiprion ocellaris]
MSTSLLVFLCLIGHVFAKKPPDVDCLVVHLQHVHCSWNQQEAPEVNYTFSSWFHHENENECATYLSENGINTGCNQPYEETKRFTSFYTKLAHGNETFRKTHELKSKVKLNPPSNLTVKNGSDFNLWFYWNQTKSHCVESEVVYKINDRTEQRFPVSDGVQNYCINLPSSSSRYELRVRSRLDSSCGQSIFWSDWSEPVVWGSNNGTDTNQPSPMSVWTPVLYVVGALTLILLVIILLHHERFRIIIIPVIPKPSLIPQDIEGWFHSSKGLKESFKANYNERACPVREYCNISQSDSESSGSSTSSVNTDQTV